MNRTCTVNVLSVECAQATAAKIALTRSARDELQAGTRSAITDQALEISERILRTGEQWSRLGCANRPETPSCAAPASDIEADFSVLSAFVLQISTG